MRVERRLEDISYINTHNSESTILIQLHIFLYFIYFVIYCFYTKLASPTSGAGTRQTSRRFLYNIYLGHEFKIGKGVQSFEVLRKTVSFHTPCMALTVVFRSKL